MKNLILFLLLSIPFINCRSQLLTLTGTINLPGVDSVELGLPHDENTFYSLQRGSGGTNFIRRKPDASGHFSFTFPSNKPIFAIFKFSRYSGNATYRENIMLSPERPLHIEIDTIHARRFPIYQDLDMKIIKSYSDYDYFLIFSDKGKQENEVALRLLRGRGPFAAIGLDEENYINWPIDSLKTVLLSTLMKGLDSIEQSVNTLNLPNKTEQAILTEYKYRYAKGLAIDFPNWIQVKKKGITGSYRFPFVDTVLSIFGPPSQEDLSIGCFETYRYLRLYTQYQNLRVNYVFHSDPDSTHAQKVLEDKMHGVSYKEFAALQKEIRMYGEENVFILMWDKFILPAATYEKLLTTNLEAICDNVRQPLLAELYLEALENNFPQCENLTDLRRRVNSLKEMKSQYSHSNEIKFHNYTNPTLKDLVAPYAGKVVYLDLWGTWCGPCREEMKFAPLLKGHFKGNSDIVFLYIDKDEDANEQRWKDYIATSNLTGDHVRLTDVQIQKVINDLGGVTGYPTYCIFDKKGNLVVKDAKRPSDGEYLYEQIDEVLKSATLPSTISTK